MMTVAILGASGFIGRRTVERFHLRRMATVRPVVRRLNSLAGLACFDLDCRLADGRDQAALQQAFAGCDAVIHAVAGDSATIVDTVAPVYRAAEAAGVRRLVYLSSASVHGQSPAPGTTETSPLSTRQSIPYNNAKVQAERMLERLRARGTVELVVLRPGIVYGPRSFWITTIADALLRQEAYLVNDGSGICNSIYVDTLVDAIQLALTTPAADRETFLLGDAETVTWAALYQSIAEALGYDLGAVARVPFVLRRRPAHQQVRALLKTPPAQRTLALLPSRLRSALGAGMYRFLEPTPTAADAWRWSPPKAERPRPQPSLEMALLQQCRYQLPHHKATALLGYQPQIPFSEAMRRSIGWLAFAGYPVRLQPSRADT